MRLHRALILALPIFPPTQAGIVSPATALRKGTSIARAVASNIRAAPAAQLNADGNVEPINPKSDPIYVNLSILLNYLNKTMAPSLTPRSNRNINCEERRDRINGTDSFLEFTNSMEDIYNAVYARTCLQNAQTYDHVMFSIVGPKARGAARAIERELYHLMEDPADVHDSGAYLFFRNGCTYQDDLEGCQIHASLCPNKEFTPVSSLTSNDIPPENSSRTVRRAVKPSKHNDEDEDTYADDEEFSDTDDEDTSDNENPSAPAPGTETETQKESRPCTQCCIKDTCVPRKAAFAVDESSYWAQRYIHRIAETEICGHGPPTGWEDALADELR